MTWPVRPHNARNIPHSEDEIFEDMSKNTDVTITDWVERNRDHLERITNGNGHMEALLGSLIIDLAVTAANRESFAVGDRRPIQR